MRPNPPTLPNQRFCECSKRIDSDEEWCRHMRMHDIAAYVVTGIWGAIFGLALWAMFATEVAR